MKEENKEESKSSEFMVKVRKLAEEAQKLVIDKKKSILIIATENEGDIHHELRADAGTNMELATGIASYLTNEKHVLGAMLLMFAEALLGEPKEPANDSDAKED
ncbi:MAG: hypothetical protein LBT94_02810 [Prevotellaceae bacterium]|jgi:hypothetical protein|nr:hypothetical protein [Prevotellaceae bacterium]